MSIAREVSTVFMDQARFMELGKQRIDGTADRKQVALYAALIEEESTEFLESFFKDAEELDSIKEALDVIVVAAGFLVSLLGVKGAQQAWDAVFISNLSKVSSAVEKREDGKILKNDQYKKIAKEQLMHTLDRIYENV